MAELALERAEHEEIREVAQAIYRSVTRGATGRLAFEDCARRPSISLVFS